MKAKLSTCPVCHSDKLKLLRSNFTFPVRARPVRVRKLERYECANCGEFAFDYDSAQRLEQLRASPRKFSRAMKFNAGELNKLLRDGEQSIQRERTIDADEALAARRKKRMMK